MAQSTEDYLDSLLRQAMGIPEPEPVAENEPEQTMVDNYIENVPVEVVEPEIQQQIDGTSFSSDKVSQFFADDAPFSEGFVYPEEALATDAGVDIPADMQLTDEGRRMLGEDIPQKEETVVPEAIGIESIVEEPIVSEPVLDMMSQEESVAEEPAVEEPIIEEPTIEEKPTEESVSALSIDDLDPNDANKALDADMIAALFAGANAESEPVAETVEEPVAEEPVTEESEAEESAVVMPTEEPVKAMSIEDLDPNDANKALDADMIAALFAGANADSEPAAEVIEDPAAEEPVTEESSMEESDMGSDISDLLSSLDNLDTAIESEEANSKSDSMEVGGLDLGEVDLGAMLDNITTSLNEGDNQDNTNDFNASDLNDLLNSIEGDSDISDIGDMLSKDENSEIVDPSAMEALFGAGSDDISFNMDSLSESDDAEEESGKKKKKAKKEKKKRKKKGSDSADEILIGGEEEMLLDPDSIDLPDISEKSDKKKGFLARLFDKLFEEVDEDADADGKIIEETALDIAVEGAAVNEEILKEAEETGKNKKKKDKKDKKKDKKKKGSDDGATEDGEESEDAPKKKKKEKKVKEKEPEEPTKKLPKKKVAAICGLCASIAAIIIFLTFFVPYSGDKVKAKKYYSVGDYEKTYEYLRGHKLSDEEQILYEKAFTLSKIERFYDSYLNYIKMGFKMEALNALIQGVKVIDRYSIRAQELGIDGKFNSIGQMIIDELFNSYGITYDQALELANLEDAKEYTRTLYDYLDGLRPRDEEGNLIPIPEKENETLQAEENDL